MEREYYIVKLEALFAEAIERREGKENKQDELKELLQKTLSGHLCSQEKEHLKGPFIHSYGYTSFEKYALLESGIAKEFARLLKRTIPKGEVPLLPESLTTEQKHAVELGLTSPLLFLSGGPGTGKTYTIAQLVSAYLQAKPTAHIVVAAPTGKAAAHLQAGIEKTIPQKADISSGTLHAVLGIQKAHDAYVKDLYLGAQLIIIDECSMIDTAMWYALLRAIPENSTLVFVGDTNQLPPVETGSIFAHLSEFMVQIAPHMCAHLSRCLRSESEEIISLSEAIQRGESVQACALLDSGVNVGFTDSVSFPPFPKDQDPEKLLKHSEKYKILSALKEGTLSVTQLNRRFAFEHSKGEVFPQPIIITQSSPSQGLFNGENGVAIRYRNAPEKDVAYFRGSDATLRKIPLSLLPRYELAYALSIHKSQGSEYDSVTVILQDGAAVFGKELLYTGITRAKKTVRIFAKKEVLCSCIQKYEKRLSTLLPRLQKEYSA